MINGINGLNNNLLRQIYLNNNSNEISQNFKENIFSNNSTQWFFLAVNQNSKSLDETKNAIISLKSKQTETKTNEAQTSEKSAIGQTGSVLGKDLFNKITFGRGSILTKLTEVTPFTVASAILGVDFEEDGAAMTEGAKTGKGGDYAKGFSTMFSRIDKSLENCLKDGSLKNVMGAFGQILSFIPNAGSTAITNTLKYIGAGLNKIGAPKLAQALGTSCEVVGAVLNSIGQGVVSSAKNLGGAIVSLVKLEPKKALESLKNLGEDFKKMGIKIKDKFLNSLVSIKDFGKAALEKMQNLGKTIGDKIEKGAQTIKNKVQEGWEKFKKSKLNPLNWF